MSKCKYCNQEDPVHKMSCPTKKMVIPAHMIFQPGTEYVVTGTEAQLKSVGLDDMRIIGEIVIGKKLYYSNYVQVERQNPDHVKIMPDHREELDIPRYMLTRIEKTDNIKEGDDIVVLYTDGNFIKGKLTEKWDEEPYCQIDNKPVDLANEGASSEIYKVIRY